MTVPRRRTKRRWLRWLLLFLGQQLCRLEVLESHPLGAVSLPHLHLLLLGRMLLSPLRGLRLLCIRQLLWRLPHWTLL